VSGSVPDGLSIRSGEDVDLPALTDIYNHYVLHTPATFDIEPFAVADRRSWFGHYRTDGPHRLLVAVRDDVIVGYATSSEFRAKPAYDTSIEVTVYLRPEATGSGVGGALYTRLFEVIRDENLHRAYAVIALPNDPSVALHRRFGFVEVGRTTEVGRKFDQWWDVLWMERPLP
jgi:phosphinothricin acetyltransferase